MLKAFDPRLFCFSTALHSGDKQRCVVLFARPGSSVGERRIAALTGSESPVLAALRARYLLPRGMACGQWQWSH